MFFSIKPGLIISRSFQIRMLLCLYPYPHLCVGLTKDEDKGSTEYINLSSDAQNAGIGQLFKIWGDAHQTVAQKRQQFVWALLINDSE